MLGVRGKGGGAQTEAAQSRRERRDGLGLCVDVRKLCAQPPPSPSLPSRPTASMTDRSGSLGGAAAAEEETAGERLPSTTNTTMASVFAMYPPLAVMAARDAAAKSALETLCRTRGWLLNKAAKAAATAEGQAPAFVMYGNLHGCGTIFAPQTAEARRLVASAVVADWRAGFFMALSENPAPGADVRHLYFDIDAQFDAMPMEAAYATLEALEKRVVRSFFPGLAADARELVSVVATSGVRVADGLEPVFSAGVHVYYPHLRVTALQAVHIALALGAEATEACARGELPPLHQGKPWSDAVDRAVYGAGRGLRWLWQVKAKACAACGGLRPGSRASAAARCGACCGACSVPDPNASMYAPVYEVDGLGRRTPLPPCRMAPSEELLLRCSVWVPPGEAPTPGFTPPVGAPAAPIAAATASKAGAALGGFTFVGESRAPGKNVTAMPASSIVWNMCQQVVRSLHAAYAGAVVSKVDVVHTRGSRLYRVQISPLVKDCTFCQNKGGYHSKSRPYFELGPEGAVQRCWSSKTPPGAKGPCRDPRAVSNSYRSPPARYTTEQRRALFPDQMDDALMMAVPAAGAGALQWAELVPLAAAAGVAAPAAAAAAAPPPSDRIRFQETALSSSAAQWVARAAAAPAPRKLRRIG